MNLWIRTQNNHLICLNDNDIYPKTELEILNTCSLFNQKKWLGTYETKERALEVLDEIHKLVEDLLNYDHLEYKVYQMPKE